MRRTWIGAAAVAGISTFAATGLALAQEKQDQQTPAAQHMEKALASAQKGQPDAGQAERRVEAQAAAPESRQGGQTPSGEARTDQAQPSNAAAARAVANATAAGKVQISSANATRISQALISTAPATSQNIHVAVNVGAPLPGDVELLPLPPAVVSLVPEYQGYEYVVVADQVVIVQPSTRLVVEIITPTSVAEAAPPTPPGAADNGAAAAHAALPPTVNMTEAQQQLLVESVVQTQGLPNGQAPDLADGQTVPQNVELMPVPSAVAAQVPTIERYRVAVAKNRVVLVDPGTRVVVHVVR